MSTPDLDRRLARYLDKAEQHPIDEQLEELKKATKNIGDGLAQHIQECSEHRRSEAMRVASTHARLEALEAAKSGGKGGPSTSLSPPPMRPPEESRHDIEQIAGKAMAAAIEGIKRSDTTPEEMVRQVVVDEQKRRDQERELLRLQRAEADRETERLQEIEDRKKARDARRKLWGQIALAAISSGSVVGTLIKVLEGAGHH